MLIIVQGYYSIAESIGEFNYLDHLEEKSLVNALIMVYGY